MVESFSKGEFSREIELKNIFGKQNSGLNHESVNIVAVKVGITTAEVSKRSQVGI